MRIFKNLVVRLGFTLKTLLGHKNKSYTYKLNFQNISKILIQSTSMTKKNCLDLGAKNF